MPCFDPGRGREEDEANRVKAHQLDRVEAMLCAVMRFANDEGIAGYMLTQLNYAEGGFTRKQLVNWYETHKKLDASRKV